MLVDMFVWLGLLILLVSIPKSRAKLRNEYQDESQYNIHPYIGIVVIDCCEM